MRRASRGPGRRRREGGEVLEGRRLPPARARQLTGVLAGRCRAWREMEPGTVAGRGPRRPRSPRAPEPAGRAEPRRGRDPGRGRCRDQALEPALRPDRGGEWRPRRRGGRESGPWRRGGPERARRGRGSEPDATPGWVRAPVPPRQPRPPPAPGPAKAARARPPGPVAALPGALRAEPAEEAATAGRGTRAAAPPPARRSGGVAPARSGGPWYPRGRSHRPRSPCRRDARQPPRGGGTTCRAPRRRCGSRPSPRSRRQRPRT